MEKIAATGPREKKRRETLHRITEAGLKLFGKQGYEATTLDAITAEAGISRRTFFHYFKSKDEILLSLQSGLGDRLVAELAENKPKGRPLEATREALLRIVEPFAPDEMLRIDKLMRSSEAVQSRKLASYAQDEIVLFAALQKYWPDESAISLRLVATLAISAVRLSLDAWTKEGGVRPLTAVLKETFNALDGTIGR